MGHLGEKCRLLGFQDPLHLHGLAATAPPKTAAAAGAAAARSTPAVAAMGIISSKETATRTCPGTGCTEQLDASEFDPSDLVLCEACDARVDAAVASEDMHWFTSHLDPTHISGCSHPELLAPSRPPGGAVEPARACVAEGAAAAASLLSQADAVLVVAGAGMSCDSGLPDFRGANGFYSMGGHEVGMEEVDFQDAKLRPRAWGYITKMRHAFLEAAPHSGYGALRRVLAAGACTRSLLSST